MFDLSWSHIGLFVIAALLVLGPKELPNAIRTGAQLLRAGRKLAGEFRSGMDELMREAELEETRRSIKQAMTEGLDKTVGEHVDPSGELKATLDNPLVEATAGEPAAGEKIFTGGTAEAKPAELAGPPNIVINDPPSAPPNSIVPPPPADAGGPAPVVPPAVAQAEPAAVPAAQGEMEADETAAGDLKKSA